MCTTNLWVSVVSYFILPFPVSLFFPIRDYDPGAAYSLAASWAKIGEFRRFLT